MVKNCQYAFMHFSDVYKIPINMLPPDKVVTPYGGRLNYTLPGENKLVVHLKDKDKIRHKKRWSQVKQKLLPFFMCFI